jgi:vacuolar protein sorting-associated protein 35
MDCLKRAIKIADICMNQAKNLYLFITLLNKYLYYFSLGHDFVSAEEINHLIDLIKEHIDQCDAVQDQIKEPLKYF